MTDPDIDLSMPVIPMAAATPIPAMDSIRRSSCPAVPEVTNITPTTTNMTYALDSMRLLSTANAKQRSKSGGSGGSAHLLDQHQLASLALQGYPTGLAQELGRTVANYPLRFWVVDNSGSMRTPDGHELRGGGMNAHGQIRVVSCTRWTELQGTVQYHASLAGLLHATTIFKMLNDPGPRVGPQEFAVGVGETRPGAYAGHADVALEKQHLDHHHTTSKTAATTSPTTKVTTATCTTIDDEIQMAQSIIQKCEPRGVTPLTLHLDDIKNRVLSMETALRANDQFVCVVLATDGLPSNNHGESTDQVQSEFVEALKALQALPVWIVVRLCTDDKEVVEYYNQLDAMLELPLEVIDDFLGEAKEVQSVNKWLNYALPLHRCREQGLRHRIFDLLDERLLNKDELYEFMKLMFGTDTMSSVPDPNIDWKGFKMALTTILDSCAKLYNPVSKKITPWIDMKQLDKCYSSGGGLFKLWKK